MNTAVLHALPMLEKQREMFLAADDITHAIRHGHYYSEELVVIDIDVWCAAKDTVAKAKGADMCKHQELYGSSHPNISDVHSGVREALALYQRRLMTIEELLFEWHERGQQRDELLAACEAVVWCCRVYSGDPLPEYDIAACEAAVAKAKGEQP